VARTLQIASGTSGWLQRVLVCDPERVAVQQLRTLFEPRGIEVVSTPSGSNALEKLRHTTFGMLMLSTLTDDLDGFEVVRRVREDPGFEDLVILMLTSKAVDEDVFRAYHYGADFYLIKPIDSDSFPWLR
jgi:DNA-binding response OmpR family regulator